MMLGLLRKSVGLTKRRSGNKMKHSGVLGSTLLALFPCVSTAESVDGIYACSGYYSGQETGWDEASKSWRMLPVKMTLNINESYVSLLGDYHFFGTRIRNPLDGTSYDNCGTELPPEFKFKAISCDWNVSNANTGELDLFLTNFGTLNLGTMRMSVFLISSDGGADFDCVKIES